MRIWIQRILAAVLVVSLLLSGGSAYATEPTETAPSATEAPTEAPAEAPTEAPTEAPRETPTELPEETEPEPTEPHVYTVDTESGIYQLCREMAVDMPYDQLLVYDATNDEILFSDTREGSKLYPASVTKLFSAYVALQYLDPVDVITVGDEMDLVHAGSSLAYIGKGNSLYVQMLVEGMMLPSGNDAAIILATAAGRKIAGKEEITPSEALETFVREMNRMAKELGFERSHFSNPDGWHTGSHYTCLNDMARIAKLALEEKTIARYMRMGEDEVTFLSGQTKEWKNTNLLVNTEEGFHRYDAIGMKTGYTRPAEYCLMSAFRLIDGRNLVVGVFGYADSYKRFNDVNRLVAACKDQFAEEAKAAKEAEKEANSNGTP